MKGALNGVRVLDLSRMLSGPYGSMILADMGAEVIKIEDPDQGDPTRTMGPKLPIHEPTNEMLKQVQHDRDWNAKEMQKQVQHDRDEHANGSMSAYFLSINRNKKSLTLDLRKEKGRKIFYELVKQSDVVFDNFRPDVLERLGCDYETLKKVNPKIISCSISSFGHTGPDKDLPAFDLVLQARGGAMSITGEPGRSPVRMGIPTGDLGGSLFAAYAVASALYQREKTGKGAKIDISLLDCQASLLTYVAQYYILDGKIPGPIGSGHQTVVPYQAFKTKDIYIVIAIFVEKFWEKLCKILGISELANDPRFCTNDKRRENRDELNSILDKIFLQKPGDEWLKLMRDEGIPSAPVNTVDRVLSDPQLLARNMVVDAYNPEYGSVKVLGNPVKIECSGEGTSTLPERFEGAPTLGQHTNEILRKLLGYSEAQINELKKEKVI